MAEKPTAKERFQMHNSLICMVQALNKHYCTIEMRNGDSVSGKMSHVDGFMNMAMDDAIYITSDDQQHYFEYFFVQARNIRFVTIPQKMDIAQEIMKQLERNRRSFCPRTKEIFGGAQKKKSYQKPSGDQA